MLKVLIITASPAAFQKLDLETELSTIKAKLLGGNQGGHFLIEVCHDATVDAISKAIRRIQPDLLHFSGHAVRGDLLFEGGRSGHIVPRQGFARLLSSLKGRLRCVVLNACTSDALAKAIAESIDCVVGIQEGIDDDAAIAFSKGFYEALAWGDSIGKAFELACTNIQLAGSDQHRNPKLFCRAGVEPERAFLTLCLETFCIAADSDRAYLDELLDVQLAPLIRVGVLRCWEPGRAWDVWDLEDETAKQLESSHLVLLLLSADLLADPERHQLALRALARHTKRAARVVPILVRPLDVASTAFRSMLVLPSTRKSISEYRSRDSAWLDIMTDLNKIIAALADSQRAAQDALLSRSAGQNAGPDGNHPPAPPSLAPARTQDAGIPAVVPVAALHSASSTSVPSGSAESLGPAAGRRPTLASIRRFLGVLFPSDSEFREFCLDSFTETYQMFASGMSRKQRVSLLLQRHDTEIIVRQAARYPAFAKHKDQLVYE